MIQNRKICIGVISGVHGVRGDVRLRSFTAEPESIGTYKPLTDESGQRIFVITLKGMAKNDFIAAVDGVKDRTVAETLKGTKLFVDRALLPPAADGQYYEADLVGLNAIDFDKKDYGKIIAVHNHGAGVFLEIKPTHNESFMLPFTDAFVPDVDVAAGFVTVAIPEGWLEKTKPEDEVE